MSILWFSSDFVFAFIKFGLYQDLFAGSWGNKRGNPGNISWFTSFTDSLLFLTRVFSFLGFNGSK